MEKPENGTLDQERARKGLGGVFSGGRGVAECGAGEEFVVGKGYSDVFEEARGAPLAEGGLDFLVDEVVEAGVIEIGNLASPFAELGAFGEEPAPAVELVQTDSEGNFDGEAVKEGGELAGVAEIVGRRDASFFLGEGDAGVVGDGADAEGVDQEEEAEGFAEVAGFATEELDIHLPVFTGGVEEGEECASGAGMAGCGSTGDSVDEGLKNATIDFEAWRGGVAAA